MLPVKRIHPQISAEQFETKPGSSQAYETKSMRDSTNHMESGGTRTIKSSGDNYDHDSQKKIASSVKILLWKKVGSSRCRKLNQFELLCLQVLPCLSYTSSSIYMTLAQKYVVSELRAVKSLFLLYQNAAALLLYLPAAAGWLNRFGISR